MAFDYPSLRDETVEPLIAEFGKSGTIFVGFPGDVLVDRDGNPIVDRDGNYIIVGDGVPWGSQLSVEVSHSVILLTKQFKKSDNRGTLVEMGDVLFLLSTEGVTIDPALANRFMVDGVIYQVVRIDLLRPGATTLKWDIHGRK